MPPRRTRPTLPVVVSVGGSVLLTGERDREYLSRLAELVRRVGAERPLVVTVGGGRTAREYIRIGRELGLTEIELDEIGIDVTRLNARLLAALVGPPAPAAPPTTVAAAVHEVNQASPIVMGGTEPGHTTDGVAALVAARLRAERLVNATNVAGLYDRDPRAGPGARRIAHASWTEFSTIVDASVRGGAGENFLFDRLGAQTLARADIPLAIVDGRDIANLEAAIRGSRFEGSWVGGAPPGTR
jgi:uridylate kinase